MRHFQKLTKNGNNNNNNNNNNNMNNIKIVLNIEQKSYSCYFYHFKGNS